ncbi:iron-containing alcohol dehydrogenase [Halanaerobium praevalens]|uniref:Iron-containing alcohol dehydrogenase n=1 Tax=Halanaerobium praevalens (strain ATCC 33744 / DSM 2228 / GSL) TaxID=572479 RepID=E3DNT7_HALPG|nr:iron-containing alcohol dehydrogenase [Halanaerobium praevalens]ADO76561.1 iron-containing alcohol dehydrogenase [Halanaerobium praevalens DSM 2228]
MQNFSFQNTTKIIFGKETEKEVGKYTAQHGYKVLVHYGGGSIKKYGTYTKVINSLEKAGIDYVELGGVEPNPKLSLVQAGIELARKEKIDFILAVGGGSVIDSAKAISVGYFYDGDVWDFFEAEAKITEALPIGVVLTIPAAGSESSGSSVITKLDGMYKRSIGSNLIRPKFAILNPELTFTLPNYQTACGAVDIMAHIMERYFTNTEDVELTDRLAESALKTIIKNTPKVLANNEDYAARAEIMWTGTIAHNGLLGTGREEDWASHGIEHELSGIYDVAHGAGLAVIFPAWMNYVYQHDLERFAQFAHRVWDIEPDFKDLEQTAYQGIKKTKEFFSSIGMPVSLKELEIPEDRLEEMAQKATENGEIGSFVNLDTKAVLEIYQNALD